MTSSIQTNTVIPIFDRGFFGGLSKPKKHTIQGIPEQTLTKHQSGKVYAIIDQSQQKSDGAIRCTKSIWKSQNEFCKRKYETALFSPLELRASWKDVIVIDFNREGKPFGYRGSRLIYDQDYYQPPKPTPASPPQPVRNIKHTEEKPSSWSWFSALGAILHLALRCFG